MPVIALFALMLFFMMARVFLPFGSRPTGKVVSTTYLSLRERSLMQRVNLYSLGSVLLLMTVSGVIGYASELVVVIAAIAIMSIPVRCVLTSEGAGVNNVVFRPWSDFSSFTVERRRVLLIGKKGTRPLPLHFLAGHQKDLVPMLRRYLPETKAAKEVQRVRRVAVG